MVYWSDNKQMFWIHGPDGKPVWFDTEREALLALQEMKNA